MAESHQAAESYHLNPATGRWNKCRKGGRHCPLGGPEAHRSQRPSAGVQKQAASPSVGKSEPLALQLLPVGETVARASELAEKLRKAHREAAILREGVGKNPASTFHGRELRKQLQAVEEVTAALRGEGAVLRAKLEERAPAFERLREVDPVTFHSNKLRLAEVFLREDVEALPHGGGYYSNSIGRLNPAQAMGSGERQSPEGERALLVLAQRDGRLARVLLSGAWLSRKAAHKLLGCLVVHARGVGQLWESPRPVYTYDLFVVGYRDTSGESHGWVPDRQLPAFLHRYR